MMHLLPALMVAWCCQVGAEELPDPTRPPPGILAPAESSAAAYPQPAGLQTVIISGRRRAAIIDGITVELGGRFGDTRLVAVNEGYVVLQGKQGRQVLSLFPDVKISAGKMPSKIQSPAVTVQPEKRKSGPSARGEGK